jgi:hypothetical protein
VTVLRVGVGLFFPRKLNETLTNNNFVPCFNNWSAKESSTSFVALPITRYGVVEGVTLFNEMGRKIEGNERGVSKISQPVCGSVWRHSPGVICTFNEQQQIKNSRASTSARPCSWFIRSLKCLRREVKLLSCTCGCQKIYRGRLHRVLKGPVSYAVGSRRQEGTGAGLLERFLGRRLRFSLCRYTRFFQVEIYAILAPCLWNSKDY